MTEFLKKYPMAIRHCLLYEFLQVKSVEESFDDFCETVGYDIIKKEAFKFWFDEFDDQNKPLKNLRGILQSGKLSLISCVMYEWLSTKNKKLVEMMENLWRDNEALPVFAKYKNFCKVIGDDVMEYPKFEFWFYRFNNQEFDLDLEWDADKKMQKFADMPIDIMWNIVEHLNTFDRTSLARTSRSFKTFVEGQKSFNQKLEFRIYDHSADIKPISKRKAHQWIRGAQEFEGILKLPKLHLEELSFKMYILEERNEEILKTLNEATDALESAFDSIQQFHVENLYFHALPLKLLLKILQVLKPGYLTTIDLDVSDLEPCLLEELVKMEQWKQANCLFINHSLFHGLKHHLYHFKMFCISLEELSAEDIRVIREVLFKSPYFKECVILVSDDHNLDIIEHEFGDAVEESPHTYHYPIPNSEEYFRIDVIDGEITIRRIKK